MNSAWHTAGGLNICDMTDDQMYLYIQKCITGGMRTSDLHAHNTALLAWKDRLPGLPRRATIWPRTWPCTGPAPELPRHSGPGLFQVPPGSRPGVGSAWLVSLWTPQPEPTSPHCSSSALNVRPSPVFGNIRSAFTPVLSLA